jgi:transposase-like protein
MLEEWRKRPLEAIYLFIYLDAIHYKVREEGHYISKAFYTVLGVNLEGKKEILGLYLNESEGAKFWLQVLTDLQNRGVQDILISSVDGLKGFYPQGAPRLKPFNPYSHRQKYNSVWYTKYVTPLNMSLLKIKTSE